jgi:undecaprenyl-diphosphatase
VASSFAALGSPETVFVFAAAMTLFFALSGRWIDTVHTVASIACGAAVGYTAKAVTDLLRPHHAPGSSELLYTSFPSGHALLATLLFGTATLLAARDASAFFFNRIRCHGLQHFAGRRREPTGRATCSPAGRSG